MKVLPPISEKIDKLASDIASTMAVGASDAIRALGAAFAFDALPAFNGYCATTKNNFYHVVCREYLKHHRRLPGSLATKRLIKKRESRVFGWFWSRRD